MKKIYLLLSLILILSFFLRFYRLDQIPSGFHSDEVVAGYNAYLFTLHGRNLSGEFLPNNIDTFGDFRPAMMSYLSVIFVDLWGPSIFSTRIPSALFGIVLSALVFWFCRVWFRNSKIALLSSFFVAVSPFALIFSRSTTDGHVDVVWELSALCLLMLAISKKKLILIFPVFLFWFLGYFTYQTSRILTPLMGTAVAFFSLLRFRSPKVIIIFCFLPIIAYLFYPFGYFLRTPLGHGRFNQVSIFSFPEVQREVNESVAEDNSKQNPLATRFFHNKALGYFYDAAKRYSMFFSPQTILFTFNQPDRYFVPFVGGVTAVEYCGLIFCLVLLFTQRDRFLGLLPLILLALAPIPSALTFDDAPNYLRAVFLSPFWQIAASLGLVYFLFEFKKSRAGGAIIAAIIFTATIQTMFNLHQYFVHQPARTPYSRANEMQFLAAKIKINQQKYPKILISERGGVYLYYLFFNRLDIFKLPYSKPGKYFTGDYKLNGIAFSKNECLNADDLFKDNFDLIIFNKQCLKPNWVKIIDKVRRPDGSTAEEIAVPDNSVFQSFKERLDSTDRGNRKQLISEINKTFQIQ